MMNKLANIPVELYKDVVVRFLADRYHTTPENVLCHFFMQEGMGLEQKDESMSFHLEDNEMEILRGITGYSHS